MSIGGLEEKSDLKDKIAILNLLISDFDDRFYPSGNRTLLGRTINEIETWINGDEGNFLEYDAQLDLIYVAGNVANLREQSNYHAEGVRQSLEAYLFILRSIHADDGFIDEEREILSLTISECDEYMNASGNTIPTLDYHAQLDVLHSMFDNYVARYSIKLALKIMQVVEFNYKATLAQTVDDMNEKGRVAFERFERLRDVKNLEEAIKYFHEAVTLSPHDSPDLPAVLTNEGSSLMRRFERFGKIEDINKAIRLQTEAVNLTPIKSSDRPGWLNNLGVSLMRRFEQSGDVEDIDVAVQRQTEALNLTPLNNPSRPEPLNNLGISLMRRFERFGEKKDIDEAIRRQTESVDLTPRENPLRTMRLNNLGSSLMRRFERFGEVKDINAAIGRQTEAVDLTPLDDPSRPGRINNLGYSLRLRLERFGELKDFDAVIARQIEAVDLIPLNSRDRPELLNNLGLILISSFEQFDEVKDLDAAIARLTEAVDLIPHDSPGRPRLLNTLGLSLLCRFKRFGKVKDVDAAVGNQTEAVHLTPLDSPDLSIWLTNLGASFRCRFERFDEAKDLDAAIGRQTDAIDLTSLYSPYRPGRLNSLGLSLMRRFERFGEVKDLEAAIGRLAEAINLLPSDNPERLVALNTQGSLLIRRFERFGEAKDIDTAIEGLTKAVDLTPLDSPGLLGRLNSLGISLRYRFERFGEVKYIDSAIEIHTKAVKLTPIDSSDRPRELNNLAESLMCHYRRFGNIIYLHHAADMLRSSYTSLSGSPTHRILAALQCADIFHSQKQFSPAFEAYTRAVQLLPQAVWIGLDAVSQLNQLTSTIQAFGSDAAACMISMSELEPDQQQQHLGRAIEVLDQTRSILWSQASKPRQNLQDLREIDPRLAKELDQASSILRRSIFRDSNTALTELEEQQYRRSAEKWEELVLEVRKLPGFHRFLLPPPLSELRGTANRGSVVVINISRYRSDALIIPSRGDLELLPLSSDTTTLVKQLAEQQQTLISGRSRDGHLWDDTSNTQDESVLDVLYQAWTLLGEPITEKLKKCGLLCTDSSSMPHIWWCLTGEASFIPIHASLPRPIEGPVQPKGMMDLVVSSYTPTLSTLARAQQYQSPGRIRMLAIGQPESQGRPALSFVEEEIQLIRGLLPDHATLIENSNATVDAVSTALPKYTWVHFACHGIQDHDKPLEGGLVLHNDQLLTLSCLARCHLEGAEFAFLSSCESATGSKFKPNESVHLAAGLQFLGFRGVIGTMWSVEDKDALYVAKMVYEELFKDGAEQARASNAAAALHRAVRRLRDEEKAPVNRWVPFIHFGL